MQFNALAFLDREFGSPQAVLTQLAHFRLPAPNPAAVEKWFQRAKVPGVWLPLLLCARELAEGVPISLMPYVGGERT